MKENEKSLKLNMAHAGMALFITFVMYIVMCIVCKIAPFGNNTWLVYDMKTMYADFMSYFGSVLRGENNIFYSFSTTLGSGTLGFYTYFLTSPFMIIFGLLPEGMLVTGITIVIGIKLALASFMMDLFLQRFSGKSTYLCSVAYGLCAYMVANAMNIMWLDVLILLPVVMLMTERLIHDGKILGYVICIAVSLVLNYYITYMVLIFVLFWTLSRMWVAKERNISQILYRFGLGTVLAVGVDSALIIPTFIELRANDMLKGQSSDVATLVMHIRSGDIISKLFSLSSDGSEVYWGAPLLFAGTVIVVLCGFYFVNSKIRWQERLSMLVLLLVFFASFYINDMNRLWHVGVEHTEFPYREAIMCVFTLITIASHSASCLRELSTKRFFVGMLPSLALLMVFALSSRVATWRIGINVVIVVVAYLTTAVIIFSKHRSIRVMAALLLVLVQFTDLGLNDVFIYRAESVKELTAHEHNESNRNNAEAVNRVKALDSGFYRMETWSPSSENDALAYAYNGVTSRDTASLKYSRSFLQRLGYNDDGSYVEYGHDNTVTADSILGIKYLLTHESHAPRLHKDYKLVCDGTIQAYENPYALSIGVGTYSQMSGESTDPFSFQEDIYSRLIGESVEIFKAAKVEERSVFANRPQREYQVTATHDGELYFYMTDLIDDFDNMEVYVDGEFYTYYGNDNCLKVLNLGYLKRGEQINIVIKADDEDEFGTALFMTEDTDALHVAYNQVIPRLANVEKISSSHLKLTLDSSYTVGDGVSSDVGVFTTIPYEKGWDVKVAGIRVEPIEAFDSLMYIPVTEALQQAELEPGSNLTIELRYIPEGFIIGVAASIITLLIMLLVVYLRRSEADYFEYDDDDEVSILDK